MATDKIRKYVLPNIPYLFIGWFCLKIGTAYRLAAGAGFGEKLLWLGQTIGPNKFLHLMDGLSAAFRSPFPSLYPADLLIGIVVGCLLRLAVYEKGRNAKKYRHIVEYGSARWSA